MKTYASLTTAVMLVLVFGLCLSASAEMITVTLQPADGKDAYVRKQTNKPERKYWNFGGSPDITVRSDGTDNLRTHTYIQFELPAINSADVRDVRLSLLSALFNSNASKTIYRDISVYEVAESWVEGTGVWGSPTNVGDISYAYNPGSSPPGAGTGQPAYDATPVATINVLAGITTAEAAAGGLWHEWNDTGLTDLVKGWLAGTTDNYGMMVRLTEPDNTSGRTYHNYRSSDYDWTGESFNPHPTLEIDVIPEPCSAWLLASGLAVLGVLWRLRRR